MPKGVSVSRRASRTDGNSGEKAASSSNTAMTPGPFSTKSRRTARWLSQFATDPMRIGRPLRRKPARSIDALCSGVRWRPSMAG